MAAETLTLTLSPVYTDQFGVSFAIGPFTLKFSAQTRMRLGQEAVVPFGGAPVALWDPVTWAGDPLQAIQAAVVVIQDQGIAPGAASVQAAELEVEGNAGGGAQAQGMIFTIPPGGFMFVPSGLTYRTPAAQSDQFVGSTATVINRLRMRNKGASVNVKASLYLIDSTAP